MGKRRNQPELSSNSLSFMSNDSQSSECRLQQKNSSDSNKKTIHMFATIWSGDSDQSELSWQKNGLLWLSCPVVSL